MTVGVDQSDAVVRLIEVFDKIHAVAVDAILDDLRLRLQNIHLGAQKTLIHLVHGKNCRYNKNEK